MQGAAPELELLQSLFTAAVNAALPSQVLAGVLPPPPAGRTLVLGAGKAAASMAQAVDSLWPAHAPMSGVVVTRYEHTPPNPSRTPARIEILEAAHPVPDDAGVMASQKILALTQGLTADDLVICLISGGGSSLLTLPVQGLSLEDKKNVNQALLKSGANIHEMNCVRKHLSQIKGGRLALACAPAKLVCLAISDVPGDDPSVIASGPTVGDPTTCADALHILNKYNVKLPAHIIESLQQGELESPKPGPAFAHCEPVQLVATPARSLRAAASLASSKGLRAYILSDEMQGESAEVAKVHAALAKEAAQARQSGKDNAQHPQNFCAFTPPCVILSGGETTVTIARKSSKADSADEPGAGSVPRGRGGRAGEFMLSLALALQGHPNIWALAADTDGIDGVESNAGARLTPSTLARALDLGMHAASYLERHDAYGFFEPLGDLVVTGPTYTNVNDFRAILIL